MMRLAKSATKLVIAGLTIGFCTLTLGQTSGGGTPVWTKITDTTPGVVYYNSPFQQPYLNPGDSTTHHYPEYVHVWDTLDEDSTLSAPWTAGFTDLLDNNPVWNQIQTVQPDGIAYFFTKYESCLAASGGTAGLQRWKYNATNKSKERKSEWKFAGYIDNGGS